jgi:type III secretion protein N (ATPase)
MCTIAGSPPVRAEVIGFAENVVSLAPLDHSERISGGAAVTNSGRRLSIAVGDLRPGQIFDAVGVPLGHQNPPLAGSLAPLLLDMREAPPPPLTRQPIRTPLITGVRSIDTLIPIGYGQRIGLIAEAGAGKSTLLGAIASCAAVDLTVIGLVGERGREINEFIENCLGPAGLARAIVVASTSDEPPLRRAIAPLTATRIAEHYRSQGQRVLLLIDSLTRYARALRDLGLARGEIPLRHGLTPSIYAELPRLLERAGTSAKGSISAIYTVLAPSLAEEDPLTEEIKSLLDGHIVLTSEARNRGFQPAIDPTRSISRLAPQLLTSHERATARIITQAIHRLLKDRDLIAFGGTPDTQLAAALRCEDHIGAFMRQEAIGSPIHKSRAEATQLARLLAGAPTDLSH